MLYGKKIHVTLSKHTQVQMPQPGSNMSALVGLIRAPLGGNVCSCVNARFIFTSLQEDGLTEDYTNSPLHRFKVSKFLFARWMQHFKSHACDVASSKGFFLFIAFWGRSLVTFM